MTIWQLYDRYLPQRKFESIAEAAQAMIFCLDDGYSEELITDQDYLANVMRFFGSNPHVPISFWDGAIGDSTGFFDAVDRAPFSA